MGVYIWLGLMAAFLIAEAACPIHLVSVWFAVGSVIAAISAALGAELWLQILLFAIISAALLAALWPFVRKFLNPQHTNTNVDSIIGSQGYVTAAINNLNATGQVKLGGMYWSARSTSGQSIPEGALIQVDRIEGVKAFVSETKEETVLCTH